MAGIPDSAIIVGAMSVILSLIAIMHKQVLGKLDELVKSNMEIKQSIAVHSTKLEATAVEFVQIREHQKEQDDRINRLEKRIIEMAAH